MSTLFLLENLKNSKINCVETFKGSDEHEEADFIDVKKNFYTISITLKKDMTYLKILHCFLKN